MDSISNDLNNLTEAFCNRCKVRTLHSIQTDYISLMILNSKDSRGKEEIYKLETNTRYQVIECNGCLSISFREITEFPKFHEKYGFAISDTVEKVLVTYFPERSSDYLMTRNFIGLPMNVQSIYKESIEAYNHGLYTLCAAGLRSLVEVVCGELQIDEGNLKRKIQKLGELRQLAQTSAESLQAHRFLGNYALHRNETPDKEELKTAIELVEHVLNEIYLVPTLKEKLETLMTQRISEGRKQNHDQ
jgi:hypothetical protein